MLSNTLGHGHLLESLALPQLHLTWALIPKTMPMALAITLLLHIIITSPSLST